MKVIWLMTGYRKRLRIWETNYGRDCGWIIEQKGKPIAILSDAQFQDMFWESYKIDVVTDDADLRQRIATREFWARAEEEGLVYRNRGFGCVAEGAFPALTPYTEDGRLVMRRLYIAIAAPRPWDEAIIWIRRWAKRRDVRLNPGIGS
jgi:hypothetical protein